MIMSNWKIWLVPVFIVLAITLFASVVNASSLMKLVCADTPTIHFLVVKGPDDAFAKAKHICPEGVSEVEFIHFRADDIPQQEKEPKDEK